MKSLRDSLPDGFLVQMQKELGLEEMLRLLWPMVVGANLGVSTRLVSIRRNTLRISVPDQTWKKTLSALEQAVLEAVHRVCGEEFVRAVEFVEDPTLAVPRPASERNAGSPTPTGLPIDWPLGGISDPELRRMFRRSAEKYFARPEGAPQ